MRNFPRIMEKAVPQPKVTRRALIKASAGLALILAVALVGFGVFDGTSKGPIEAQFVRFDRATNGYATRAILSLTNKSGKPVGSFDKDGIGLVSCRFFSHNPTGEVVWHAYHYGYGSIGGGKFDLRPHSRVEATATLPEDGRTGRVALVLQMPIPPVWIIRTRRLFGLRRLDLPEEKFVISDQEIQCPRVLPDGTVEPPRLLSAAETKR